MLKKSPNLSLYMLINVMLIKKIMYTSLSFMILVPTLFSCTDLETFKVSPYFFREFLPWNWIKRKRKLFFAKIRMLSIWDALRGLIQFVQIKNVKKIQWRIVTFSKLQAKLKVTLLHGCFSRFLNCTNCSKLLKASPISMLLIHLLLLLLIDRILLLIEFNIS